MIPFKPRDLLMMSRLLDHGNSVQERLDTIHDIFPSWLIRLMSRKKNVGTMEPFVEREVSLLRDCRQDFAEMGMDSTTDQIDRILLAFEHGGLSYKRFIEMHKPLLERIEDDLKRGQFFMVPPHKASYYAGASTMFGAEVSTAFPSAQSDIEQAAKCYAFGRNTAVAFHLMRVMEVGLRALGVSLKDTRLDMRHNPTWETILRRCDDELRLPVKDRSLEWKTDPDFYYQATANLRAVKDAWRNPTMHIERDYDEEEALELLNSTKSFMRHLSSELSAPLAP